jgi:hypothetical protein
MKKNVNCDERRLHCIRLLSVIFFLWLCPAISFAAQVTLAWDANVPTPDGYRIFARAEGSSYNYNSPNWSGSTQSGTIYNLRDNATFYFVVRAYVGNDESGDSNEVSYRTTVGPTLSSIRIDGPTQVNESSSAQYTCTAIYSDGSTANVSSSVSWSDNSSVASISSSGRLTAGPVNANTTVTVTASYNGRSDTHIITINNAAATMSSITISGPTQVSENSSAQYTCTAIYSDGSTANVSSSVSWSDNSSVASISSSGRLTAGPVNANTTVTVTASYNGRSDTHIITINNAAATMSSITISGPTQVSENSSAQYTCTAIYSDGSTANVSSSVSWSDNSSVASISSNGRLTAGNLTDDRAVTITAAYNGRQDTHRIVIINSAQSYSLNVDIQGSGAVALNPPGGTYDSGTVVTLTAMPDRTWTFDGWIGSVVDNDSPVTAITMDATTNLLVTFLKDTDLDSIPDQEEWGTNSQDQSFDGNDDGIADYLQSNVASIHTNNHQHYLTLSVPEPGIISSFKTEDINAIPDFPTECTMPIGLIDYTIENITPGARTIVTIHLLGGFEFNTYYRYGATLDVLLENWYEFLFDPETETGARFGGDRIELYLKDGGQGDDDLLANGVIKDSGGPGILRSFDGQITIDDGDPGTTAIGNWSVSGGSDPYGTRSLYGKEIGDVYTFQIELSGRHAVALWWSGYKSRCDGVPVEIFDGDTLIDTVVVDQSQDSGHWNALGIYDFSGAAKVNILSESNQCSTSADAAYFRPLDLHIDDGDDVNDGNTTIGGDVGGNTNTGDTRLSGGGGGGCFINSLSLPLH